MMGIFIRCLLGVIICLNASAVFANQQIKDQTETIVIMRHGEQPKKGLGQLSCKGLQRSLLLPHYLLHFFPKPNYIFAPNPAVKVYEIDGDHKMYYYIRPLATIEPTAIRLGMPVNISIAYNQPKELVHTLLENKYHNAIIYVVWEHHDILKIAQLLLKNLAIKIPDWNYSNYKMVFVFTIHWSKMNKKTDFKIASENIGSRLTDSCP